MLWFVHIRRKTRPKLAQRGGQASERGCENMPGGRPPTTKAPEFGARLAALRKACGLSQLEFADKAGISRPMVDYYERRAPNPAASFVIKAADVLGVTTDELLGIPPGGRRKVGRKSKLDRYVEQVKRMPRAEQEYVVKFLEQAVSRHKS